MDDLTFNLLFGGAGRTPVGQQQWITPGTYSFVVPTGVYWISAVCIGAGGGCTRTIYGGGGGGLRYARRIAVTPGEALTIVVGAGVIGGNGQATEIRRGSTVLLQAGGGMTGTSAAGAGGQGIALDGNIGGGNGGSGGATAGVMNGGGGAGGYAGNGGSASTTPSSPGAGGGAGAGGAGTGGIIAGGAGGGVGLHGQGASGVGGTTGGSPTAGGPGSNGQPGSNFFLPGLYGGGAPGRSDVNTAGASGAARIIHGDGRYYPSTNTQDF